jgi:antitoxin component HigA of HigAB toxin-antitoxin module
MNIGESGGMSNLNVNKSALEAFAADHASGKLFEEENLLVSVTELLTEVMETCGIKRAELAKRIGKSKAFVTQVLRGNQNMTLRTLSDLFYALDARLQVRATPLHVSINSQAWENPGWKVAFAGEPCSSAGADIAKRYFRSDEDPKFLVMLGAA